MIFFGWGRVSSHQVCWIFLFLVRYLWWDLIGAVYLFSFFIFIHFFDDWGVYVDAGSSIFWRDYKIQLTSFYITFITLVPDMELMRSRLYSEMVLSIRLLNPYCPPCVRRLASCDVDIGDFESDQKVHDRLTLRVSTKRMSLARS